MGGRRRRAARGDRAQIGVETSGATPVQSLVLRSRSADAHRRSLSSNVELHAGLKVRVLRSLFVSAGAGPGLTDAVRTPSFRAIGAIAWAPLPEAPAAPSEASAADPDADGVADPGMRAPSRSA